MDVHSLRMSDNIIANPSRINHRVRSLLLYLHRMGAPPDSHLVICLPQEIEIKEEDLSFGTPSICSNLMLVFVKAWSVCAHLE